MRLKGEVESGRKRQGFASMDPERRKELQRKGGKNVPADRRGFAKCEGLAEQAGGVGGHVKAMNRRHREALAAAEKAVADRKEREALERKQRDDAARAAGAFVAGD